MQTHILFSLVSGGLGATASCLAKFAFDANSRVASITEWVCTDRLQIQVTITEDVNLCFLIQLILARGICLVGMIVCNALMLGTFLKGMQESGSVAGTALSTAANFIISACYGYLFWKERFSSSWWIGFVMIISGVLLLANTTKTGPKSNTKTSKED